jgi:hypothetical protein
MRTNVFKWLIVVLTLHIFAVMAGLLHGLNGKNEALWIAVVFAASYSVASAFVVYIAQRKWLVFTYAIADGLGVLAYYFDGTPQSVISVYFGVYTFGLIASTIYISSKQTRKRNGNTGKQSSGVRATTGKTTVGSRKPDSKSISSNNRKRNITYGTIADKTDVGIRQRKPRSSAGSKDNATATEGSSFA